MHLLHLGPIRPTRYNVNGEVFTLRPILLPCSGIFGNVHTPIGWDHIEVRSHPQLHLRFDLRTLLRGVPEDTLEVPYRGTEGRDLKTTGGGAHGVC